MEWDNQLTTRNREILNKEDEKKDNKRIHKLQTISRMASVVDSTSKFLNFKKKARKSVLEELVLKWNQIQKKKLSRERHEKIVFLKKFGNDIDFPSSFIFYCII
jgi:predicted transcriptional regulator